jgi:hypothetical protein
LLQVSQGLVSQTSQAGDPHPPAKVLPVPADS